MDQEINSMMIENTEAISQLRTENITDSNPANVDIVSNASDGQTEDKYANKNKKQKIANVDGKNKKDVLVTKSKDLKRKREPHLSTANMVMASIKSLRKHKGASLKDISKYMEENYKVNTKRLKLHINRFLEKSVENDTLEKVSGNADEEKFKIKKAEKAKKEKKVKKNSNQNLMQKGGKKKHEKKTTEKRQVKK